MATESTNVGIAVKTKHFSVQYVLDAFLIAMVNYVLQLSDHFSSSILRKVSFFWDTWIVSLHTEEQACLWNGCLFDVLFQNALLLLKSKLLLQTYIILYISKSTLFQFNGK